MPKFNKKLPGGETIAQSEGINLDAFASLNDVSFPRVPDAGAVSTSPNWGLQQLAAIDGTQRLYTSVLGKSAGIPFYSGQAASQFRFLQSIPAADPLSQISQAFAQDFKGHPAESVRNALALVNSLGFDALQGAVGIAKDLVDGVPIINLVADLIQSLVQGGMLAAAQMRPTSWKTLKIPRPVYDPDNDANATEVAMLASGTRDWTSLFSPADESQGLYENFTIGTLGATNYPNFSGVRTEKKGEWLYAQLSTGNTNSDRLILPSFPQHWGFVPPHNNKGGRLWRGVLIDKRDKKRTSMVGDVLPTAQATGNALWQAVLNPVAPQIFFVDAVQLQKEWLNYLVLLRRGLHWSHRKDEFQDLKRIQGERGNIYGEGTAQKRMWLSLAEIDDGDLEKKISLRREICAEMQAVFGWKPWQPGEDDLVRRIDDSYKVSDQEYIERFGLEQSVPVQAAVDLYNRQLDACQSATVLYSRGDDPAFRSAPSLRNFRNRSFQRALQAPNARGMVDDDMLDPVFAYQATQLVKPGTITPATNITPAIKSATFKPAAIWLGDGPAPAKWSGGSNTTNLPVIGGASAGGGGAGLLALAALGAGAYFMFKR